MILNKDESYALVVGKNLLNVRCLVQVNVTSISDELRLYDQKLIRCLETQGLIKVEKTQELTCIPALNESGWLRTQDALKHEDVLTKKALLRSLLETTLKRRLCFPTWIQRLKERKIDKAITRIVDLIQ